MSAQILITTGDPKGIGPEITQKAYQSLDSEIQKQLKIIGPIQTNVSLSSLEAGKISFDSLKQAQALLVTKKYQAVVTAPVCKSHLRLAGFHYPGQTEFFRATAKVKNYAMMLTSNHLRVVLITIHQPLAQVSQTITPNLIIEKAQLTHSFLKSRLAIKNPKLAITSVNPHAGENGQFGLEENFILAPALSHLREKGILIDGPLASDSLFAPQKTKNYDAILACYHDQGLGPFKTLYFDTGVNLTLGLPFVRCAPDHGTAFDIAGKNAASFKSMKEAILTALKLVSTEKAAKTLAK